MSDFWYLLSDPTPQRLARMIRAGMQSAFPKLLFVRNRMKIERLIEEGLLLGRGQKAGIEADGADDISLHLHGRAMRLDAEGSSTAEEGDGEVEQNVKREENGVKKRGRLQIEFQEHRRSSLLAELKRQSGVFFDDPDADGGDTESEVEEWASAVGDRDGDDEHEKMT